jgi:hypothetical protein
MTPPPTVPSAAAWLGGLGFLPFLSLSLALTILDGDQRALAARALLAYGGVILSFLGGVQWGLAIAAPGQALLWQRLSLSVVPSLLAWLALLLPTKIGFCLLVLSLALVLWADLRAVGQGAAPAWYGRLRLPLSAAVMISLAVAALW